MPQGPVVNYDALKTASKAALVMVVSAAIVGAIQGVEYLSSKEVIDSVFGEYAIYFGTIVAGVAVALINFLKNYKPFGE